MSIRFYDFMDDGFFEMAIDKRKVGEVSLKDHAVLELVRLDFEAMINRKDSGVSGSNFEI